MWPFRKATALAELEPDPERERASAAMEAARQALEDEMAALRRAHDERRRELFRGIFPGETE